MTTTKTSTGHTLTHRAHQPLEPHKAGSWYLAPESCRSDDYSAGYDGNAFATREEAEAAIPVLQSSGEEFAAVRWVAVQR